MSYVSFLPLLLRAPPQINCWNKNFSLFFFFLIFIWLPWALVVLCGVFRCSAQALVTSYPLCACSVLPSLQSSWTIVHQAPLSIGFSRQEYWGGFPFSQPEDRLNPGIEPAFLVSPALSKQILNQLCHLGSSFSEESGRILIPRPWI